MSAIRAKAQDGTWLHTQTAISLDLSGRLLAKLALGVGYKSFGPSFLTTPYAKLLRQGFREANAQKRRNINIKGTGYLNDMSGDRMRNMQWTGAWVLTLKVTNCRLILSVIAPSSKTMQVAVSDDAALVGELDQAYRYGKIWLTIPSPGKAVGPIPLPEYIAPQLGTMTIPQLAALAARRIDPSTLPACRKPT